MAPLRPRQAVRRARGAPRLEGRARAALGLAFLLLAGACGGAESRRDLLPLLEAAGGGGEAGAEVALAPGESAAVALLLDHPAVLEIEARADGAPGAGSLVLRVERVAPFDLGLAAAAEPLLERALPARDGRVTAEIELPSSARRLLSVELAHSPEETPGDGGRWLVRSLSARERGERVRRPSIVFLSVDTLAARHLSAYGYARRTSPEIDRLARESVLFEQCSANAPWTTPSYMSQLGGLFPLAFRYEDPEGGGPEWFLPEACWTLPEVLRALGYRTAAFVDNPNIPPELGFGQGFEVYDTSAARIPVEDHSGGIRKVAADGLAWLDSLGAEEPSFLFLQCLDVHGPYVPPDSTRGAFEGDALDRGGTTLPVALEHGTIFDAVPRYVAEPLLEAAMAEGDARPDELRLAALVRAYDEEILALDAAVGELVEALRERGALDDSILVLSADHGESFAHHSYCQHALPYEDVAHVPFLVRLPGGESGGLRVSDPVQLVDLYPTLLDLVEAPLAADGLHGRSLAPAVRGAPLPPRPSIVQSPFLRGRSVRLGSAKLVEVTPRPEHASFLALASHPRVQEWLAREHPDFAGRVPGTSALPLYEVRTFDFGALWRRAEPEVSGPFRELYDLARDPDELDDRAASSPELVARLLQIRDEAEAEARAARARLAGGPGPGEIDPELRRQLSALGYVAGED